MSPTSFITNSIYFHKYFYLYQQSENFQNERYKKICTFMLKKLHKKILMISVFSYARKILFVYKLCYTFIASFAYGYAHVS